MTDVGNGTGSAGRAPTPMPPGWPPPERMAAIMEATRRRVAEYRAEFEGRGRAGGGRVDG